jgi:hypothetical protein
MQDWTLPQRQEFLRDLAKSKPETMHSLLFQNHLQDLPVYRVPIELPCYRLANGRTRALQAEHLATHTDVPADFFSIDPDSAPALAIQDDILRRMVNDKNLKAVLAKEEQTEPLILDENGYVVNGNRRLCAMRMLVEEDAAKYSRFKHIRVVVLPKCTPHDIRELEAKLQVLPDTRAEYTWVDLALMQRALRDDGSSDSEIAALYDTKVASVQDNMRMLDEAEAYLASRGCAGQYSKVYKQGKYAFQKILKHRLACSSEPERDIFTTLAHLLVDDPSGGRLYESIPDLQKHLPEVTKRLSEELPGEGSSGGHGTGEAGGGEDPLMGSVPGGEAYSELLSELSHTDQRNRARTIVQDTLEEIEQRERERRDAEYCIRLVAHAHTDLQTVMNAADEEVETHGIAAQLDSIELLISRIREWLQKRDHN